MIEAIDVKRNRKDTLLCSSAAYGIRYVLRILLMFAAILVSLSSNAYAYIDPGSGALIWQLVLSAFFGAMFFIRNIRLAIRATISWIWNSIIKNDR